MRSYPPIFFLTMFQLCVNIRVAHSESLNNVPEFPPKRLSGNQNFPTGHLQPFGYQRAPDGPVKEYKPVLRPEVFWQEYVNRSIPLILLQGIGDSPALSTWTDHYLEKNYGNLDVLVELKEENRSHSTRRMNMGDFLAHYKEDDIYVVTVLPDPMRREIQVPSCLLCGSFLDYIHETNFWMSSGGTRSVIHYDADHNLHCLVAGRKDFIMIEEKYYGDLYFFEKKPDSGSSFSGIDPNKIDLKKYPNVANVPWTYATLMPGDCIYIPAEYIHQVRSYNRTISATILFTSGPSPLAPFDPKGCEKETFDYTALSEVNVHWTYNKGDALIEMGFMNIEVLRHSILNTMRERNAENFTKDIFIEFWNQHQEETIENEEDNREKYPGAIFDWLDTQGKGIITKDEVIHFSKETLKKLARLIDPPHGPLADKKQDSVSVNEQMAHKEL